MSFGFGNSGMDIKNVPLAALDTMLVHHDVWTLRLFRDHTMERLVHALDGLGDEWEREEERLRSQDADSEYIGDAQADFVFIGLHVEQETRNTLAVSLYHLFEKQVTRFARRALRHRRKDAEGIKYLKDVEENLRRIGLDCRKFSCLPAIEVLRIVANIVKHGKEETRDADLAKLPRDLFRDPARGGSGRDDEVLDDVARRSRCFRVGRFPTPTRCIADSRGKNCLPLLSLCSVWKTREREPLSLCGMSLTGIYEESWMN